MLTKYKGSIVIAKQPSRYSRHGDYSHRNSLKSALISFNAWRLVTELRSVGYQAIGALMEMKLLMNLQGKAHLLGVAAPSRIAALVVIKD